MLVNLEKLFSAALPKVLGVILVPITAVLVILLHIKTGEDTVV